MTVTNFIIIFLFPFHALKSNCGLKNVYLYVIYGWKIYVGDWFDVLMTWWIRECVNLLIVSTLHVSQNSQWLIGGNRPKIKF